MIMGSKPSSRRLAVAVVMLLRRVLPISSYIHSPLLPFQQRRPRTHIAWSSTFRSSTKDGYVADEGDSSSPSSFEDLGLHPVLLERLQDLGLSKPTAIQSATLQAFPDGRDLIVGSETGSGKTYAYLLPLLNDVLQQRQQRNRRNRWERPYDYARALILVPNKELVQQVVRMALPLAGGPPAMLSSSSMSSTLPSSTAAEEEDDTLIRLAVVPGGLDDPEDFRPIREALAGTAPPPDLLLATPAAFGPFGTKPKHIGFFADVGTLVVDEADLCVDGGYIRAVEQVLMGFRRADKLSRGVDVAGAEGGDLLAPRPTQHVFVAATLPNYGLKSVDRWIEYRFPRALRVQLPNMHRPRHSGLTAATDWRCVESKRERLQQLVELLDGELASDKVMVFCNSVSDADGAAEALRLAGVNATAYHAKLPSSERAEALQRFRDEPAGTVVLVCTDLAARGLDVPNVTAVVQLQFAGNAVAHLHRMGRCGRTGSSRKGGRGVIFFSEAEHELVRVLQSAEREQENLELSGDVDAHDEPPLEDLEDSDEPRDRGTVERAFSRKRGFTKKRKKLRSSESTP